MRFGSRRTHDVEERCGEFTYRLEPGIPGKSDYELATGSALREVVPVFGLHGQALKKKAMPL